MGESEKVSEPKKRFARAKVPFALVTVGVLAFGVYYLRFVERETSYFSDRNARLIVGLAAQLRESVDATSEYAKQAAGLKKE